MHTEQRGLPNTNAERSLVKTMVRSDDPFRVTIRMVSARVAKKTRAGGPKYRNSPMMSSRRLMMDSTVPVQGDRPVIGK